jgi:hypothetical protein
VSASGRHRCRGEGRGATAAAFPVGGWSAPGRIDSAVLGRHRRHSPAHRRVPGQERPIASDDGWPAAAGRRWGGQRRSATFACPVDGKAIEVDRVVSGVGTVWLGQHLVLAAEILAGRQVGIRIDPALLMFFDLQTRELLRTRPNPLTIEHVCRLRGARRAGPPPRPCTEPIRVQRRASIPASSWSSDKDCTRPHAQTPDRHRAGLRYHARGRTRRRRRPRHPSHHHQPVRGSQWEQRRRGLLFPRLDELGRLWSGYVGDGAQKSAQDLSVSWSSTT